MYIIDKIVLDTGNHGVRQGNLANTYEGQMPFVAYNSYASYHLESHRFHLPSSFPYSSKISSSPKPLTPIRPLLVLAAPNHDAQGVAVGTGHLLQTSNCPDVSEGEQIRKGTCATAQRYWQHGLTAAVGQALALLREHVEVMNEEVELFVVVAAVVVGGGGSWLVLVSRQLQALLIR